MCVVVLLAALPPAVAAYDLHDRTLVPISEDPVQVGDPIELVRDGRYRCAIAWNPACEPQSACVRSAASITPALTVLTNAFAHTFGAVPPVIDAGDEAALAKYDCLVALGNSMLTRRLGFDPAKEPEQGFTIRTCGKTLVIHGHDGSQIPSYNAREWERRGPSRGTYYGAVDFTERFLGARYYLPGEIGTLWKKQRDLTINPVSYTDFPRYNQRGNILPFIWGCRGEKNVAKWKRLLGDAAAKPDSYKFVDLWRCGGTLPTGGGHGPEPFKFAARHPDRLNDIFYENPYGRLCHDPKEHVGNVYDVTDLGLVDLFAQDIAALLSGPQKCAADAGWPTLNDSRISWGQCDTYMNLIDYAFNPTVRKLGLINRADVERARLPDGSIRNDAGCFANLVGRFTQAYAERVKRDFDAKLFVLAYYNAKFPPNDPRFRIPDNVQISFCDHRFPTRILNAGDRADLVRLTREWKEALGGRPVERIWLYGSQAPSDYFLRAIAPELVVEVSRALGDNLGREVISLDTRAPEGVWHNYFAHYASCLAQWNPDVDQEAVIREHWVPFYGPKVGPRLRAFHDFLVKSVRTYHATHDKLDEHEKMRTRLSASVVDRLESLLEKARAVVEPGTVESRRFEIFAEPWPEAFKLRREEIETEYVWKPEEWDRWRRNDIRIDSWDEVYTCFRKVGTPYKTHRGNLILEFANPLTRYSLTVVTSLPTARTPVKQELMFSQGPKHLGFFYGDAMSMTVNGTSLADIEILPEDIKPLTKGRSHGYEVSLKFPTATLQLRLFLRPDRRSLLLELVPDDSERIQSASVKFVAVPSHCATLETGGLRMDGYRREVVTPTRVIVGRKGAKAVALAPDTENEIVFRDAEFDGSGPGKGVGPCALLFIPAAVQAASVFVSDNWKSSATLELKPHFEHLRLALYEDLDRPVSNADFMVREWKKGKGK